MSYHIQQNTKQRSLGFFFVIAFHALLIAGLISGLSSKVIPILNPPDPIRLIQAKPLTKPLPTIEIPDFSKRRTTIETLQPITPIIQIEHQETVAPSITPPDTLGIQVSTITKPKLIRATKPEYPTASTRLGEEGITGLRLLVTADGRVTEVKLDSTSGSDRLDAAALKHAQHNWAFAPCTEGGVAVACWFQAKLVWRLDEAKH